MRVSQGIAALGLLCWSAAALGELETGNLEIGNVVAVDASLAQPNLLDSPAGCSSVTVFAHPAASGIYVQAYPWVGTPEYHKRGDPSFRFFPSSASVWSLAQYTQGVATAYLGVHLSISPATITDGHSLPNGHTDANVQFTSVPCPDTGTGNNPPYLFVLNDGSNGTEFFGGVLQQTAGDEFSRVRKIAQSPSGSVVALATESVAEMRLKLKATATPVYLWDLESADGLTLYGRTPAISALSFHVPARTWGFPAPAGVSWRSFSIFEVDPVGGEFQFQMPVSITVSSSTNGNDGTYSLASPPKFSNGGLVYERVDGFTIRRISNVVNSLWVFVNSVGGVTAQHNLVATDSLAPVQVGATFTFGEALSFTYPAPTTAAPTTAAPTTAAPTTAAPTTAAPTTAAPTTAAPTTAAPTTAAPTTAAPTTAAPTTAAPTTAAPTTAAPTTVAPTTAAPTTAAPTTAAPTTTASLCPTSKGLQIDDGAICYNGLDLRLSLENLSAFACPVDKAGVDLGSADTLCVGTYNIAAMINEIANFGSAAGPCGPESKGLILDADHKVCFGDGFELVSATLAAYNL